MEMAVAAQHHGGNDFTQRGSGREQRQCPCIPGERQNPGVLSKESPSLKQDTSCPIQTFVLAWIEVWVCA